MAVITPNTDIYLLKVPLEIDETNQLTFANATAQYNYFNSLPKLVVEDYTYQRKDGTIRFAANFDDVINYNYVMYRNTEYSNKWFYAYITDMAYVNDNVTVISIKTDVWQTWQFDLTYKPVFVEREHVNDDTPYLNTVPEDIDTGEPVVNKVSEVLDAFSDPSHGGSGADSWVILMGVTQAPTKDKTPTEFRMYNGLFQGLYFLVFTSVESAQNVIRMYDEESKSEAIYSLCMTPKSLYPAAIFTNPHTWVYQKQGISDITAVLYIPTNTNGGWTNTLMTSKTLEPNYRVSTFEPTEVRVYNVDGYEFHNNKMFTYPYCYMYITNNGGNDCIYRWEDFKLKFLTESNQPVPDAKFNVYGAVSTSPATKLVPVNYKQLYSTTPLTDVPNYSYGMSGQKFAACSWSSDYFTNWLTQNGTNILNSMAGTFANAAISGTASALTLNPVGLASTTTNLLTSVGSTMSSIYQASLVPDQAKGDVNCGDINYSIGKTGFTLQVMSIRYEYARRIDQYWDMFGYKVNTVKVPNITGRRNWNYVKTIGCYIDADIPQADLEEIKGLFDKGITLWHNPATFADYSQNNDII